MFSNLIAATSGRSFWILDDLSLIRQHKPDSPAFAMYQPAPAYLANGRKPPSRAGETR